MRHSTEGYTILEMLIASLIAAIVSGGTLMAFVTAARINRSQVSPETAEANLFGQQTLEGFYNRVAADDTFFSALTLQQWQDDALPAGGGTESIRTMGAARRYCVIPQDCDADGILAGAGAPPEVDCYSVQVRVCWDGAVATACPIVGTAC